MLSVKIVLKKAPMLCVTFSPKKAPHVKRKIFYPKMPLCYALNCYPIRPPMLSIKLSLKKAPMLCVKFLSKKTPMLCVTFSTK